MGIGQFLRNLARRDEKPPVRQAPTAVVVQQTREPWNRDYIRGMERGLADEYDLEFYRLIRRLIPPVDAAIQKLAILCGDLQIGGPENVVDELGAWMEQVGCNRVQRGFKEWENADCRSLLVYGRSCGEVVLTNARDDIYRLVNVDSTTVRLKPDENGEIAIWQDQGLGKEVLLDRELITYCVHQAESGDPRGRSLLDGLQFVSEGLLVIEHAVKRNWERIGAPGFLIVLEPPNDWQADAAEAQKVAQNVMSLWEESQSKRREGKIQDFSYVGSLKVMTIGADGQILDMEIPYRAVMEQLVSKTHIPPFLFGFNWATTERMSSTQAEMLVAYIEGLRSERLAELRRVIELRQKLRGLPYEELEYDWSNVGLQDMLDEARVRQINAVAHKGEIENALSAWRSGWIDQVTAAQAAGFEIEEAATPMEEPPAAAPAGIAALSLRSSQDSLLHKADWVPVSYGSDEQPADERVRTLIDSFYNDLRRSGIRLRDAVLETFRLSELGKTAKAVFRPTEQQIEEMLLHFEEHFREVAGMDRTRAGFVSAVTGDGLLQDHYVFGMQLGVLRAYEAGAEESARLALGRDHDAVRAFLERGFDRLSEGGRLRLEGVLDDVREVIRNGMELGQNPLTVARRLRNRFDAYNGWQFERLARTEVGFAQNRGFVLEANAEGVDTSRVDVNALPLHPNCLCGWGIRDIGGRLTLVYEVALNACDACRALAATNPV